MSHAGDEKDLWQSAYKLQSLQQKDHAATHEVVDLIEAEVVDKGLGVVTLNGLLFQGAANHG